MRFAWMVEVFLVFGLIGATHAYLLHTDGAESAIRMTLVQSLGLHAIMFYRLHRTEYSRTKNAPQPPPAPHVVCVADEGQYSVWMVHGCTDYVTAAVVVWRACPGGFGTDPNDVHRLGYDTWRVVMRRKESHSA